jgi:formate hydrogenlyase subunit 6/NADH:ubiquinone oxidoreductase subunit I
MSKLGALIPEMLRNLTAKPVTRMYPFEAVAVPAGYRGVPKFNYEKCVGCQLCVKDCTAEAIAIVQVTEPAPAAPAAEGEAAPKIPKKFRMELYVDRCIHCARCAEVCARNAIVMDERFELAGFTRPSLLEKTGPVDK